jgi:outer membrane protein OmpA-like peptidoglycan-associated protein
MRRSILAVLTIYIGLHTSLLSAGAQTVQDMTGHEPTSEEFVRVLKPRMRGIALASQTVATCADYRQTRGIAPVATAPVADIAAIHVTFAFNSARLTSETIPTLRNLGEALQRGELEATCIQIEGHTDSIGSDDYNLRLSQRRAESVIRYLVNDMGVEADRLIAIGKGEQEPIADNAGDAGRQKNRRVQIVNLGYAKAVAQGR